jgi:hypothetical protein
VRRPVRTASVPHGDFAPDVAALAAKAGIEVLFTSTPTTRPITIDGCRVYGRYAIKRWMSAQDAAAFVHGGIFVEVQQRALWEITRLAKSAMGPLYDRTRRQLLERGAESLDDGPGASTPEMIGRSVRMYRS